MPDLSEIERDPTLDALKQQLVRDNPPQQRVYLGGSVVGRECERQLWFDFRWVLQNHFDADTLARFADGHASEKTISDRLKAIQGVTLWAENEKGEQYGFEELGGHLRGHLDGVIKGLLQAPKTTHVWVHKAVNERKWRSLQAKKEKWGEKQTLEQWDPVYYAQAQIYMGQSKLKRHYLTVATPGSRDITSCHTDFHPAAYKRLMEKAKRIVFSPIPLEPISKKPDYYICRWCSYKDMCFGEQVAQVNCRTWAHITPKTNGTWFCEFHKKTLTNKEQRSGCNKHVFIPALIPFGTVTDMDQEANTITYKTEGGTQFINANENDWSQYQFTSRDLKHLTGDLLDRETDFFSLMARFDGGHTESVIKEKKKPEVVFEPTPSTST